MSTAPAITHSAREQWLARRRELVTASDVAAVLGIDPRRGALAVYADKVGDVETEETLPMRRGRRYQSVIAEDYAEQTGRLVEPWPEHEIVPHPDVPFLGATLDALTCEPESAITPIVVGEGPGIPLELKMAIGSWRDWAKDEDGNVEAPLHYQVQAQIQAACLGTSRCSLAALVGPGPLAVPPDYERDDDFFAAAVEKMERFWFGHVVPKIPPPADALPGTSAAIRRLWPRDDGTTVALSEHALLDVVAEWNEAKQVKADADEVLRARENELRARLGDASFGALADGSFLSLRVTRRKGYTVEPTTYRTLRHERPRRPRR